MQARQLKKSNIVEKILRDKEGRLVRARFTVYENAGRIKARLIDFVYLEEFIQIINKVFLLPFYNKTKLSWAEFFSQKDFSSPFIQGGTLYFSGSKPRAPTLI